MEIESVQKCVFRSQVTKITFEGKMFIVHIIVNEVSYHQHCAVSLLYNCESFKHFNNNSELPASDKNQNFINLSCDHAQLVGMLSGK